MRFFNMKERKICLLFFLICCVFPFLFPFNDNAQKLLFKYCHAENNLDSLKKLLDNNQTSSDADRLKNLIRLDRTFLFRQAIFEKLNEIKTLSDKLNNNVGLTYYYFIKAFF